MLNISEYYIYIERERVNIPMILGLLCRLGGSRGGSNGITDGETSTDGVFMGFTGKKMGVYPLVF